MRTTVKIDDGLLNEVKAHAAASGKTLNIVVEDALREAMARRRSSGRRGTVKLPTFHGGRLREGVELDDSVALIDRMEGTET